MNRKIIISLLALFGFLSIGAIIAVLSLTNTTDEMNKLLRMHEVEGLRRQLLVHVTSVQNNIYTVNTPYANKLDDIVDSVLQLEQLTEKCSLCHHPPGLTDRLIDLRSSIENYENALSYYITSSAGPAVREDLQRNAVKIGDSIRADIEDMSHTATDSLKTLTESTEHRIRNAKRILVMTLILIFSLGVLIALYLKSSITRPVNELVNATRKISSGEYGITIEYNDKTEFGELARHFNDMSAAIKEGYEKIQNEITVRVQTEEALSKSEKFLSTMFDSIRDPFCIIDKEYRIVKINDAYADIRRITSEDVIGEKCYEVLQERKSVCDECIVEKTFRSTDPCAKNKPIYFQNQIKAWLEIYTYPIFNKEGEVSHVIEYIRDITDRKFTEDALRESEERYALAAKGANDGLWDWDLKSNSVYFSSRWKVMLGLGEKEVTNNIDEWLKLVHPEDRLKVETELSAHIEGLTPRFKHEYRMLHKDGTHRWMLSRAIAVRDALGKAYRMAGSMTDITERMIAEKQLIFDAFHDSLTGLPNRTLFMDRLRHAINREKRNKEYLFAVLFLDIDRFKILNDSFGHSMGDKLLISISQRLMESLRPGDTVARFGGDEFAVLLEDLKDRQEAFYIAERIQDKLGSTTNLEGKEIYISASIGITFSTLGYEQPDHFLRDADIAMYQAKSGGSARYAVFDKKMYINTLARMQLETDLRHAIKQNEFVLHYQPIVSVRNGKITGLEALLRWQHQAHGLISPGEFIDTAEETGLIISLGEWVLQQACRQLCIWQGKFPSDSPLTMSVNISSKQLFPDLVKQIGQITQELRLAPNSLILEITEGMLMENAATISPLLEQIRNMNVQIHIDDFGTGYSSLSYLHNFPIDVLKIDRSFVARIGLNGENLEIVNAITTLAHSLNMQVIAEGVETEEQLAQIKLLHCEYIQGYLISKPLDSKTVEVLLQQGKVNLKKHAIHS